MSENPLKQELEILAPHYVDAWVELNDIRNEKGDKIEWLMHQFQIDIYNDQSDKLVVIKAAQVGLSTLEIIKNIRDAERNKMDIIYTLPTDNDVKVFVGGKVNRIIANNPYFEKLTEDKDSIEQKQIGQSMIYFRGTWSKKAAIMVTADRLVHDEKDSSKQDVIADYQARLQHSRFKQTHVFSHPSVVGGGVDIEWKKSDQKEWFITCPHCKKEQYLEWNTTNPRKMNIDIERQCFVCKYCQGVLSDRDRAFGRWKKRYNDPKIEWSGYHVSLLMCAWVSAKEIIDKYNECVDGKQTMDFFYNKVLGLPYEGGGNTVLEKEIKQNWTPEVNTSNGRMILGVDTGVKLRWVLGNDQGLVGYGEMADYMPDDVNKLPLNETIEWFLIKHPELIAVIDQGGDIIGSRKLREKYPGRVFLCHYARDRKTMSLVRWGEKAESGNVIADRNRMIQLVVDEFRESRIPLYGGQTVEHWHNFWLHFSHIYRVWEEDGLGVMVAKWLRSDRDDWVHATVYWRIGLSRFGETGSINFQRPLTTQQNSYNLNPDGTVDFNPDEVYGKKPVDDDEDPWWVTNSKKDWRVA